MQSLSRTSMRRRAIVWMSIASLVVSALATPVVNADDDDDDDDRRRPEPPINIQILGLNDFHGQLEVVPATASSAGRIRRRVVGTLQPTRLYPGRWR